MNPRTSTAALVGLLVALVPAVALADPIPTTPIPTPEVTVPIETPLVPAGTTPVGTTPEPVGTNPPTPPPLPTAVPLPSTPDAGSTLATEAAQQVLVRFRPNVSTSARLALIAQAGGALDAMLTLDDTALVDMNGSIPSAVSWLGQRDEVVWAEPNAMVQAATELTYQQGDPFFTRQWGIENYGNDGRLFDADIDALSSWVVTKGSGATVGVVDTGVDAGHPDLAGQLVDGVNFMPDGRPTTADGSGHGTHVTGIIAAVENTIGIVGAAPAAKVEPLRALDDTGAGTSATIASAFAYAGKEELRVVNASLGASAPSRAVSDAIAASPDTLFVVAAGNAGVNIDNGAAANYPCQYDLPNILCVGATDDRDQPATFSNRGATSVDLSAPGVGILSTTPNNAYAFENGTSMATPFVSAVAAQVAAVNPTWTAAQLRAQIIATVDQPASLRGVNLTGGRVNAARAVGLYAGPDGQRPATVTGVVGTPGIGSATLSWQRAASIDLAIYQVEVLKGATWTQQTVVQDATAVTISGLTPGVPVSYRVRGIDRSGEEGDPSAVVTVIPTASPAPTPTAPSTGGAGGTSGTSSGTKSGSKGSTGASGAAGSGTAGTGSRAGGSTGEAATLSAVRRTKTKGRVRAVAFKLSAASQVTVTATSSAKGTKAQAVITKTFSLAAGQRVVKFGSGTPALRLKKGTWRITIATKASKVSLKVAIR